MKITGTGVDIVENSRMKKLITNNSFLNRVFTNKEILISKNMKNKSSYFAKRFAAKEAVKKAILSQGEKTIIPLNAIEIRRNSDGPPQVHLLSELSKVYSVEVSISHTDEYAIAVALASIS